ncbi:MAG: ATP-binding cassette domain-containing protein, partial [Candidatus Peribacteraceae bacterium]|nr:ATP-binding cassette domain-containing protein [Candidatus Peribacteraceae bacterium]
MKGFAEITQKEFLAKRKSWHCGNAMHAFQGISMALLEGIGMYITLNMWLEGKISGGTVVLIQMFFYMVMYHIWKIGHAMSDVFKALSDAEEMVYIFQSQLGVKSPLNPEKVKIKKGEIKLQNITFRYEKQYPVFKDFSLHIPSGQKVGIVGHSGVGKSTLFKLLLRFTDVTDGSINIDGQDIRNITQDDLRRNISYVPQEAMLFHRSLYENISYAAPDASLDEVIEAAKNAHAHDFIAHLPAQYDTLVGERGVKLSGGERQRVAIARVILKDAPILLLDEATSSLDSISEKYVQEQLAKLMNGKTTLAIAHRISTIQQMDRIIVLNPEGIVEDGSHDRLLKQNGVYADLWKHQSHGFIADDE